MYQIIHRKVNFRLLVCRPKHSFNNIGIPKFRIWFYFCIIIDSIVPIILHICIIHTTMYYYH